MTKQILLPLIVCLFTAFVGQASSQRYEAVLERSKLGFRAYGVPSIGSEFVVNGHFNKWQLDAVVIDGKSEDLLLTLNIDVASLGTGIARRDKHLRSDDFFWVKKFPRAEFVLSEVQKSKERDAYEISGTLELRGIKRKIKVPVVFTKVLEGDSLRHHVVGHVRINRTDFGMTYQPWFFLIPKVKDEVDVHFDIWLQPKWGRD